jgi:hypothetical protein
MIVGPRFPDGLTKPRAMQLARDGYVKPSCFGPDLPEPLAAAMGAAIATEPDLRQPDAAAFADELRSIAFAMGVGDPRAFLAHALTTASR